MKKQTFPALALAALAAAGTAFAAGAGEPPGPAPHGPGTPHGPGIPPAEALATIDGLGAAQQADIRKILRERRDAEDALGSRLRAERETLDQRERAERERIEDQATQKLRAALGEDGYRSYARWATQGGPMFPPLRAPEDSRDGRAGASPGRSSFPPPMGGVP